MNFLKRYFRRQIRRAQKFTARLYRRLTAWPRRRREAREAFRKLNEQLAKHREFGLILDEQARRRAMGPDAVQSWINNRRKPRQF